MLLSWDVCACLCSTCRSSVRVTADRRRRRTHVRLDVVYVAVLAPCRSAMWQVRGRPVRGRAVAPAYRPGQCHARCAVHPSTSWLSTSVTAHGVQTSSNPTTCRTVDTSCVRCGRLDRGRKYALASSLLSLETRIVSPSATLTLTLTTTRDLRPFQLTIGLPVIPASATFTPIWVFLHLFVFQTDRRTSLLGRILILSPPKKKNTFIYASMNNDCVYMFILHKRTFSIAVYVVQNVAAFWHTVCFNWVRLGVGLHVYLSFYNFDFSHKWRTAGPQGVHIYCDATK